MNLHGLRIGYAMTGSFCTLEEALEPMRQLIQYRVEILPIFSHSVARTNTRFYHADELRRDVEALTNHTILDTVVQVEPFGPKAPLDLLIIAPCTGNTLGKLANGISDTPVTVACKAHLRNQRPVVLAISTNDGLSASAPNIGRLMNTKNVFFVPYGQDDPFAKPTSLVAKFALLLPAAEAALEGRQFQPLLAT